MYTCGRFILIFGKSNTVTGEHKVGPDWSGQAEGMGLGVSSGQPAWHLSLGEASCGAEDSL